MYRKCRLVTHKFKTAKGFFMLLFWVNSSVWNDPIFCHGKLLIAPSLRGSSSRPHSTFTRAKVPNEAEIDGNTARRRPKEVVVYQEHDKDCAPCPIASKLTDSLQCGISARSPIMHEDRTSFRRSSVSFYREYTASWCTTEHLLTARFPVSTDWVPL